MWKLENWELNICCSGHLYSQIKGGLLVKYLNMLDNLILHLILAKRLIALFERQCYGERRHHQFPPQMTVIAEGETELFQSVGSLPKWPQWPREVNESLARSSEWVQKPRHVGRPLLLSQEREWGAGSEVQ